MYAPLVSIICNCYNHSRFVIESIKSVQNQTYKNIELIVLNNGSTDNSHEIIQSYLQRFPEVKYINQKEVLPLTQAFNKMERLANGEYLIDLAADDVMFPDMVEKLVEAYLKMPKDVGIVFGNAQIIDEEGNKLTTLFETNQQQKVLDQRLHHFDYSFMQGSGKNICSVSAMMKRSIFQKLGGYDETLFFEDLDYWFRLARKFEIRFIDEVLVYRRVVKKSMESQIENREEHTQKINYSLLKIYNQAIEYNGKSDNQRLLQRIHYSMHLCIKNRMGRMFFRFLWLEAKCRAKIWFSK